MQIAGMLAVPHLDFDKLLDRSFSQPASPSSIPHQNSQGQGVSMLQQQWQQHPPHHHSASSQADKSRAASNGAGTIISDEEVEGEEEEEEEEGDEEGQSKGGTGEQHQGGRRVLYVSGEEVEDQVRSFQDNLSLNLIWA
jgi:hypothetical protein